MLESDFRDATWTRKLIGFLMRLYRKSPLYPWSGKALARLLVAFISSDSLVTIVVKGVRFELDLREVIDSSLYYAGSFEPLAEKIIAEVVTPGMVAIDGGIISNGGDPHQLLHTLWDLGYTIQTDTGKVLPANASSVELTVLPGTKLINLFAIPTNRSET